MSDTACPLSVRAGAAACLEERVPLGELHARAAEGSPAARSAASIASQPDWVTTATPRSRSRSSTDASPPGTASRARVLEQQLDGLGGVLLVRADHPGGAALDPAGAVRAEERFASAASTRPRSFGTVPVRSSNGTPGRQTPRYPTLRKTMPHSTVSCSPVATARPSTSSLRASSTASTLPSPRIATGEVRNRSTIRGLPSGVRAAYARRWSTLRLTVGGDASSSAALAASSLERGGVDDDVCAREIAELPHLDGRPRGLHGAAAAEDEDLLHARGVDRLDRTVGRVSRRELLRRQRQHPRDVERDVPVPDHDRALVGEVELEMLKSGWPLYQATNAVAGHGLGGPHRGSRAGDRSALPTHRRSRRRRPRAPHG